MYCSRPRSWLSPPRPIAPHSDRERAAAPPCPRRAPESAVTNSGLGCMLGKTCHSTSAGFLASDFEIGQADIVPLGARADVDQDRVLVLAREFSRPSPAPRRRRSRTAGDTSYVPAILLSFDMAPALHLSKQGTDGEPAIDGRHTARQGRRKTFGERRCRDAAFFRSSRWPKCCGLSPSFVFSAKRKPPVSALARVPAPHAPSR